MDDLWNAFVLSGKVEDYLKYKQGASSQSTDCELKNENYNKGNSNQGTNSGGE